MKLNIQLECNCTKDNITNIFKILDEEMLPFSLTISKMKANRCTCALKCKAKNMKHFMKILYDNCIKDTAKESV
mgnify:FL=1